MYKGHEASISSLKYSPDGLWIASGDEDGCVKVSYYLLDIDIIYIKIVWYISHFIEA